MRATAGIACLQVTRPGGVACSSPCLTVPLALGLRTLSASLVLIALWPLLAAGVRTRTVGLRVLLLALLLVVPVRHLADPPARLGCSRCASDSTRESVAFPAGSSSRSAACV